ncbi:MAG: anthranilate phosphoribosyltransferase [Phycisphaerales bacterium]|nr:anthranilate phosphoribosyltransferase [Phycisphaerales bacterium]
MDTANELPGIIRQLQGGRAMSEHDSERVFLAMLAGSLDEAQVGALLGLIQTHTPDAAELTGAARAMRAHVTPVAYDLPEGAVLIDTCGTGGAPKTFNVSTGAAIIAASVEPPAGSGVARIVVAKHGNRSRTGRGSAEVLAALGVNIDASPAAQGVCLAEAGVCFCFAVHHHPAMRYAMGPRRSLGVPTIFNALGPLTNPAGAQRQVIGVYDNSLVEPIARTLVGLGARRAMVVHAMDGLDELTITAKTRVMHVDGEELREELVDPSALGLRTCAIGDLQARDAVHAASVLESVFRGEDSVFSDMLALTTAGALIVAGVCDTFSDGVEISRSTIRSGRAMDTLESLIACSNCAE